MNFITIFNISLKVLANCSVNHKRVWMKIFQMVATVKNTEAYIKYISGGACELYK
jgi:hypothetical protein